MDNQEPRVTEQAISPHNLTDAEIDSITRYFSQDKYYDSIRACVAFATERLEQRLDQVLRDLNGPTHFGEPVTTRQAAPEAPTEQANSNSVEFGGIKTAATTASASPHEQSNVPPPFAASAQHVGAFTGDLPEHVISRIACSIEREIDDQFNASGMSPRDMQRQDGDAILSIVLDELAAAGCISADCRCRAQRTDKENNNG